jgi:four helix bundle protein
MRTIDSISVKAYKLSEAVADDMWRMVNEWEPFAQNSMGKETIAAADNIGANISQAVGCQYVAGYQHGLRMARGAVFTTRHWLRRAYYRNLATDRQAARIRHNLEEILRYLESGLETYKHHPVNSLLVNPAQVDRAIDNLQPRPNGNRNGHDQVGAIEVNYNHPYND